MKSLMITPERGGSAAFRVHRLGLHEEMRAGLVDRPEGTGDYLFMFFHSHVLIGGEAFPPGLMIWTPSDGHHYGVSGQRWDHSWFHCSGREIAPLLARNRIPLRKPLPQADPSLLERYLLETASELGEGNRPDPRILLNLFENFVRGLARQLAGRRENFVPAPLLEVRAHLERHFALRPPLAELARRAGCSAPHLCAEFKRCFGMPVMHYARQLRMSHAAYHLRDRNLQIADVAGRVGYPDLFTFSKMFKRHFGVSPRGFRNGLGGGPGPGVR